MKTRPLDLRARSRRLNRAGAAPACRRQMKTAGLAALLLGSVSLLTLGSTPAFAQAITSATGQQVAPSEVIVTATKRNTRLEDTPVAITAFTAAEIDADRITNFSDVGLRAPGLEFIPYSRQEAYVSIRGTTTNSAAAGADLGVTVFIDGVPTIGVGDNDPDLFDLKSIEVLRGPQGTLFGRNVTGGALVVNTLEPSFTPHVSVEGTYGNDNLAQVRAYVTGPIIPDVLAGKVTLQYRRQDGYLDNVDLGSKALSTDAGGGRAQLLWTPGDNLKVLAGVDYAKDSSPYKSTQLIGNFQPSLFPTLSYNPKDTNEGIRGTGDAENGGAFVRVEYTLPFATLTSITGFRDIYDFNYHSTSGEPYNELLQNAVQQGRQYTEELRLASPTNGRFSWVAGLFYLRANRQYETVYDLNIHPGVLVSFVPPYSKLSFTSTSDQHIDSDSYAAFGEANYAITPKLRLTLGARATWEDKSGHSEVSDTSGLDAPLSSGHYSHDWKAFTPKATLSYQFDPNALTYLTVSTGFKSGGYDTSGTTAAGLANPFKPENVLNFEGGIKLSEFNHRLTLNVAAYYAEYKDLQVNEYNQALLQFVTANAGRSNIPGVEAETEVRPFDWLTLNASYAFVGSNYSHYSDGQTDYSHNQIPFTAKNQYHLGGEIHSPTPQLGGGRIQLGGDVTWRTRVYFDDGNTTPGFILNQTSIKGLVNLHLTWTSPNDRWEVSLWGKNVTNTRYVVLASDLTPFYTSPGEYFSTAGNKMFAGDFNVPSMFGLTATYHY